MQTPVSPTHPDGQPLPSEIHRALEKISPGTVERRFDWMYDYPSYPAATGGSGSGTRDVLPEESHRSPAPLPPHFLLPGCAFDHTVQCEFWSKRLFAYARGAYQRDQQLGLIASGSDAGTEDTDRQGDRSMMKDESARCSEMPRPSESYSRLPSSRLRLKATATRTPASYGGISKAAILDYHKRSLRKLRVSTQPQPVASGHVFLGRRRRR